MNTAVPMEQIVQALEILHHARKPVFLAGGGVNIAHANQEMTRLAESFGAKGIRVTRPEDMEKAFERAKQNLKTPTVIEFIIDREINVLPIVPPGNALNDMILES